MRLHKMLSVVIYLPIRPSDRYYLDLDNIWTLHSYAFLIDIDVI